jgi:hypothetical protein
MPFEHDVKSPGDLIRSAEWNAIGTEVQRLGGDKVDRAGDTITGPLAVRGDLSVGTANAGAAVRVLRRQEDASDLSHGALVLGTDAPTSASLRLGYGAGASWIQGQGQPALALNPRGGNVGVGTAAPASRLSVAGSVSVGAGYAATAAPANGLIVEGNVGIGTNNPQSRLHVAGGDLRMDANRELFFADNGQIRSVDNNHRILFRRSENKLELREYGDIVLSPGATAGNETAKAVLTSVGRLGIGVAAPQRIIHTEGGEVHSGGGSGGFSFSNRQSEFVEGGGTGDRWVLYAHERTARLWSAGDKLTVGADGTVTASAYRFGNRSVIKGDQGGSIELGGDNDTAGTGTPYIDFHFSGLRQDYNARIINDANGHLSVHASKFNVKDCFAVSLACADFNIGHPGRRGSPGRALVDETTHLTLNYGSDWPGGVKVHGRLQTASGRAIATANNKVDLGASGWVDLAGMQVSLATTGNPVLVLFKTGGVQIVGSNQGRVRFRLLVNNAEVAMTLHEFHNQGWDLRDVTLNWLWTPGAGTQNIRVQWHNERGIVSCCWYNDLRSLIAVEL